jgi:glycosyltransferase involved in cell wall biosynthesis
MRIVFVLPGRSAAPVGGFKVVYEYSNRLVERGHEVAVIHPRRGAPPQGWRERIRARRWMAYFGRRRKEIAPWFDLDPRVELRLTEHPRADPLPSADAIVATAWQTAGLVAEATGGEGQPRGYYLIQHLEPWDDREKVLGTWRLPLHKIVIAHWLEDVAVEIGEGERTTWIPNGLDFSALGVEVPPADREPRVGALISPFKGVGDVIEALTLARERIPGLAASTYGTRPRPAELPEWVEYERLPSPDALRAFYNRCSIFLQASHSEGWGLPATEAMACGCALVTYENGGSREYAIDGETAAVLREHGGEHLARAIVALGEDRRRRLDYAERGRELVETFTWTRAVQALEALLGAE